jgi:hypothetical protein
MRKHFVQFGLLEIKASLKVGSFLLTNLIALIKCRVLHSVQAYYYNLRNAYSVKNKRRIIKRFPHLWTQKVPLCTAALLLDEDGSPVPRVSRAAPGV